MIEQALAPPSWTTTLNYEFQVRWRAINIVKGRDEEIEATTFSKALKLVRKDAEHRQLHFTVPYTLEQARGQKRAAPADGGATAAAAAAGQRVQQPGLPDTEKALKKAKKLAAKKAKKAAAAAAKALAVGAVPTQAAFPPVPPPGNWTRPPPAGGKAVGKGKGAPHPLMMSRTPDGQALCYKYNKGLECNAAVCQRRHLCQFKDCYGEHPIIACDLARAAGCTYA